MSGRFTRLNSINDLIQIFFDQSVPEHSLVLLYWLANTIDVGRNAIWLTFEPNNEDYGSHYYGNFEGLLPYRNPGHLYYTVGHLYQDSSVQLPSYVVSHRTADMGGNRARIIIRVEGSNRGQRAQMIDAVYITQHYETFEQEGTRYDPQHTYEISINLLRRIREFSMEDNQRFLTSLRDRYARNISDYQLNDIRNRWGNLAGLELLLLIVMQKEHHDLLNYRPQFRQTASSNTQSTKHTISPRQNDNSLENCCIILVIFIILFVLFVLPTLSQTNRRW